MKHITHLTAFCRHVGKIRVKRLVYTWGYDLAEERSGARREI